MTEPSVQGSLPPQGVPGDLVHPNETMLGKILLVTGILLWVAIILGTFGVALICLLVGAFFYLILVSGFVSHMRGTGAITGPEQYPDLHNALEASCRKLAMPKMPTMILLHANGVFNALAVRFLRRHYVVLYSDIVDALEDDPDAITFYIGHELGHIRRNHLFWQPFMAPVSWLPLIGAAYSRAREMTCDRHGVYCCTSRQSAMRGMAALAVGAKRYKTLNLKAYAAQLKSLPGFWMSYHEIISDYPYLIRRIALLSNPNAKNLPRRNPLAWILGVLTPRLNVVSLIPIYLAVIMGAGMGKGFSMIKNAETMRFQQQQSISRPTP